jgi:hypothetical protein
VPVRTEIEAPARARASERPAAATEPVADEALPRAASRSSDEPTRASRRAAPSRPRTPAVEPSAPRPVPDTAPDPVAEDSLTAELALLQRAREALRDGRAGDAVEPLDEHARRFPRGQLADERRALEAKAAGGRTGDP